MSNKQENTMIDFAKSNKITMGVLALLLVLILGFVFLNPAKYTFKTTLDQELSDIKKVDYQVSPQKLATDLLNKDQNLILIDVRNQFEFAKGHLPEAKNIYHEDLMTDEHINFFRDLKKGNKKAVLYGNTASEANVPFMILKQMGIENIGYLTVGYEALKSENWAEIAANTTVFNDETAVVDFAQYILDANVTEPELVKTATKPTEVKPKVIIKPKVVETGSDEGC